MPENVRVSHSGQLHRSLKSDILDSNSSTLSNLKTKYRGQEREPISNWDRFAKMRMGKHSMSEESVREPRPKARHLDPTCHGPIIRIRLEVGRLDLAQEIGGSTPSS